MLSAVLSAVLSAPYPNKEKSSVVSSSVTEIAWVVEPLHRLLLHVVHSVKGTQPPHAYTYCPATSVILHRVSPEIQKIFKMLKLYFYFVLSPFIIIIK